MTLRIPFGAVGEGDDDYGLGVRARLAFAIHRHAEGGGCRQERIRTAQQGG